MKYILSNELVKSERERLVKAAEELERNLKQHNRKQREEAVKRLKELEASGACAI